MSKISKPLTVIKSLDHLVLTCKSIPKTIEFYTTHLSMTHQTFTPPSSSSPRHALLFGSQKINLHQAGAEFEPKALAALPGTADLCFLIDEKTNLDVLAKGFEEGGIQVLEGGGSVMRTGARGPIRSVYVRDPDGNLIELSKYEE